MKDLLNSRRRWIATATMALLAGLAALPAMAYNHSAVYTGRSTDILVERPTIGVGVTIPGVISGSVVIPGTDRDGYAYQPYVYAPDSYYYQPPQQYVYVPEYQPVYRDDNYRFNRDRDDYRRRDDNRDRDDYDRRDNNYRRDNNRSDDHSRRDDYSRRDGRR